MSSIIPDLPELHLEKIERTEPILNQLDDQTEELLKNVKPKFKKIARIIICEYSMSKMRFLDNLFKKYKNDYCGLRTELQKYIIDRKISLEESMKHLK